jgi:hypothetical protein
MAGAPPHATAIPSSPWTLSTGLSIASSLYLLGWLRGNPGPPGGGAAAGMPRY